MDAAVQQLIERVREAHSTATPLSIQGSGSKAFLAAHLEGEPLDVTANRGIVDYEPTELVLSARAGTPLAEVEALLARNNQMLPFEPPHFGSSATIGGCVAVGWSGPRRAAAGALRDFVLGTQIIDGRGQLLRFGGKVIKNVAGYDVSRLLAGSFGTLGVITSVSFKVLPRPEVETTLQFELDESAALQNMNAWAGRPLPISATYFAGNRLLVRLSGTSSGVKAARQQLGGAELSGSEELWRAVREQTRGEFSVDAPRWRVSLPSTAVALALPGKQIIEWGGALRWYSGDADAGRVQQRAQELGGSAIQFRRNTPGAARFHPLSAGLLRMHERLKSAFDPARILNRQRCYAEL